MLDGKKSNEFNCGSCSPQEQALRNCSGKGAPAKILLNHRLYTRCPKAIYLDNITSRIMVEIYFECRKNGTYPAEGSWMKQTAYCVELFNFLDNIVAETDYKNMQQSQRAAKATKK